MRASFSRNIVVLLVVASMPTLTGLACVSPPDPSWIRGIYDDVDFDDVVDHIMATSGVVDALAEPDPRPGTAPALLLLQPFEHIVLLYVPTDADPRGPPSVSFSSF